MLKQNKNYGFRRLGSDYYSEKNNTDHGLSVRVNKDNIRIVIEKSGSTMFRLVFDKSGKET